MQAVKLRNEGIGRRKRLPVPSEEVLSRNMSSEAAGGGYMKVEMPVYTFGESFLNSNLHKPYRH